MVFPLQIWQWRRNPQTPLHSPAAGPTVPNVEMWPVRRQIAFALMQLQRKLKHGEESTRSALYRFYFRKCRFFSQYELTAADLPIQTARGSWLDSN